MHQGDIYKATYTGHYCTPCESFWLERQLVCALNDAEAVFDNRCKDNQEERRAINKHYISEAEKLHEAYLQHVEQNRQERESEEGGEAV